MGLIQAAVVPKDFDGMSWWLLHVTTENLRLPSKILWASTWVMQQVLARYTQQRLHELEAIIADGLAHPLPMHDVDGEFQYWAAKRIAGGLVVKTFRPEFARGRCTPHPAGEITFEGAGWELVRALPDVKLMAQKPEVLFYSQRTNEPLCDAAMVRGQEELLLFQMTIGKSHAFKVSTWNAYCKAAEAAGLTRVRFLFVVPFVDNFLVPAETLALFSQKNTRMSISLEVAALTPHEEGKCPLCIR